MTTYHVHLWTHHISKGNFSMPCTVWGTWHGHLCVHGMEDARTCHARDDSTAWTHISMAWRTSLREWYMPCTKSVQAMDDLRTWHGQELLHGMYCPGCSIPCTTHSPCHVLISTKYYKYTTTSELPANCLPRQEARLELHCHSTH
jgi:hypothetical protein